MPKSANFETVEDTSTTATPAAQTASDPTSMLPFHTVTIRQDAIPEEKRGAIQVTAYLPEDLTLDTMSNFDTPFADGFINNRMISTALQVAGIIPTTQSMTTQFWTGSSPIDITLPLIITAQRSHEEITSTVLLLKSMQMPRVDPTTKFMRAPGPRIKVSPDYESRLEQILSAGGDMGGALGDLLSGAASSVMGAFQDKDKSASGLQGENNSEAEKGETQDAANADKSAVEKVKDFIDKAKQASGQASTAIDGLFIAEGKISITIGHFLHFNDVLIRHVSDQYNIILGPDGRPQKCLVTVSATTRVTPVYEDLVDGQGKRGIYMVPDPLKIRKGESASSKVSKSGGAAGISGGGFGGGQNSPKVNREIGDIPDSILIKH